MNVTNKFVFAFQSKNCHPRRGEYNVYSTFQSHEPEFDYLKSLEIEEKINKIRWLKRKNPAHFLLSTNGKRSFMIYSDWSQSVIPQEISGYFYHAFSVFGIIYLFYISDKTIKLWKVSERDKRAEGYNLRDESGQIRDPTSLTSLRVSVV